MICSAAAIAWRKVNYCNRDKGWVLPCPGQRRCGKYTSRFLHRGADTSCLGSNLQRLALAMRVLLHNVFLHSISSTTQTAYYSTTSANMSCKIPDDIPNQLHMLCDNCKSYWERVSCLRFTIEELRTGGEGVPSLPQHLLHSQNRAMIDLNASLGCHFCSIILGSMVGCTGNHYSRNLSPDGYPVYIAIDILNETSKTFLLILFPCEQGMIDSHDLILNSYPLQLYQSVGKHCFRLLSIVQRAATVVCWRGNLLRDVNYLFRLDLKWAPVLGYSLSDGWMTIGHSHGNPTADKLCVSYLQTSTFSKQAACFARLWIMECKSTHDLCGEDHMDILHGVTTKSRLKRLLDILASWDLGKI